MRTKHGITASGALIGDEIDSNHTNLSNIECNYLASIYIFACVESLFIKKSEDYVCKKGGVQGYLANIKHYRERNNKLHVN